jgi:hypothetical protein
MPLPGKVHGEIPTAANPKLPGACRKEAKERGGAERQPEKISKAGQLHRSAAR